MSCFFFSRFQSWRIMPIVITSAFGSGSAKKSSGRADTRSARPAAAIFRSAIAVTAGRSAEMQRMCGCRSATSIDSWPVAPPTSHSVLVAARSRTSRRSAWKLPAEIPAIASMNCSSRSGWL